MWPSATNATSQARRARTAVAAVAAIRRRRSRPRRPAGEPMRSRIGASRGAAAARQSSCVGSHRSGSAPAGRGRVRVVRASTRVEHRVRCRPVGALVEPCGHQLVEGLVGEASRGHAVRPSPDGLGPCVRLERGAHLLHRAMEPRPDGAGRPAEDIGGLLGTEADVVVEDDDRPMVDVQPAEAAIELIAIQKRVRSRPARVRRRSAGGPRGCFGSGLCGPRDGTR